MGWSIGSSEIQDEDDPRYFDPLPPRSRAAAAEQWDWITAQLAASTADHIVVAGHYPVYSVCEHGNTQNLIDHLKPLLEQYHAHYFSGHDHCMSSVQENGIQYVVSGMGDTCCYAPENVDSVPEGSLQWYVSRGTKTIGTMGGFADISFDANAMTVTFYDQDGVVLYTAPALPPRVKTSTA